MISYLPIIVSILALLFAVYSFFSRNSKENASELTTVIVKLENIGSGIADIKAELNTIKKDQRDDHDKLIRIDESLDSAWHRINTLEKQMASLTANNQKDADI